MATLFLRAARARHGRAVVEANGDNIEPFLYIVLIWLTRSRPNWGGLVLGIGFLNREFTIYGLAALLTLEAAHRRALHA